MKTYWLVGHKTRLPIPGTTNWLIEYDNRFSVLHAENNNNDDIFQFSSTEKLVEEKKPIYSPITFSDVRERFSISDASGNNNLNKAKGKFALFGNIDARFVIW